MKVLAINGSPRKTENTATLLKNALEGAASQGAETELVHIYDYNFKGCRSCLACRRKDRAGFNGCAMRDELTPLLEKLLDIDVLLVGSPIYFSSVTGELRSFFERAAYPYLPADETGSRFPKNIKVGLILNLGISDEMIKSSGMDTDTYFGQTTQSFGFIFGLHEFMVVSGTTLDADYEKYLGHNAMTPESLKHSREKFPGECKKAFDMGVRLSSKKP